MYVLYFDDLYAILFAIVFLLLLQI